MYISIQSQVYMCILSAINIYICILATTCSRYTYIYLRYTYTYVYVRLFIDQHIHMYKVASIHMYTSLSQVWVAGIHMYTTCDKHIHVYICDYLRIATMRCIRLEGSIKLSVSFTEYSLLYRALFRKGPLMLSILLTKATPYLR